MGHAAVLLGLLAVSVAVQHAAAAADCGALLKEYYEFNRHQQLTPAGAQDLLYVLRTPNTYARELDTCLIRFGVPGTQRCPSFGEQIEDGVFRKLKGCSVLSSSDDLSVLQKLSLGSTAVAAELRDPVERLVEAYELAVEVALQKLDADRAKSPFEAMQKQHPSDVWPWSKFTPLLAKDLAQRVRCCRGLLRCAVRAGSQHQCLQLHAKANAVITNGCEVRASCCAVLTHPVLACGRACPAGTEGER